MLFRISVLMLAAAIALPSPSHAAVAGDLLPIDTVLPLIGNGVAPAHTGTSQAAQLLLDISAFRSKSASLSADRAAADWLALWDRARALAPARAASDYGAFDTQTGAAVGLRSVIAALPQPSVWPVLRQQAVARAKQRPDDVSSMGLQFITEILSGDKAAVIQSLAGFERAAIGGSPEERESKRYAINRTRATVNKLYGSREQIAEGFVAGLDTEARMDYGMAVEVPDLVGLVGAARAESMLLLALRKPVSLHVAEGEATRELARKLALSEIATLRKPQWSLIDGIGTASLYEAMQKRFDPAAADAKAAAPDEERGGSDYLHRQAATYYFLDLVIAGRHADAERAMVHAAGGGSALNVPKEAMAALVRAGKDEALYAFLSKLLERRPQVRAWNAYLEQAAYLGRGKDAVVLLDTILKQELPPYLRTELRARRLDALLGADQVDAALAGFRELLSAAPKPDDEELEQRASTAIRLAALGRVLKQPALAETGFAFARQALALPTKTNNHGTSRLSGNLMAELRRQGRASEAQAIALGELQRESRVQPGGAAFAAFAVEPAKRAALIELAGIYDAAGRSSDVLRLLNDVGTWGARDLLAVVGEKDSLGTPLGLMAARALKAAGNTAAAKASVRAVLDQLPGYDAAYQLLVELTPGQAVAELDLLHTLDQFEERPLIWKAIALHAAGQTIEAETTIRRAIAIDPSDGEQGPNDRMRAYTALADIVEARGDATSAKTYRRAVQAIRLSEQADELHKLGLYERAFAAYRAALDQFSDAYCIQSRLAVRLGKLGLHEEALKHYRRAYELMPDSFGRVESHCFGCESVFVDGNAQSVAERVFSDLVKRAPPKPQAPYLLGYLRKEQRRYGEAIALFRQAVALDADYLNAWKHLHELAEKTYMEAVDRDIARFKLLELDPRQRHVRYDLTEVVDLAALWRALDRLATNRGAQPNVTQVYPLAGSAREQDQALAKLPSDLRAQMQLYIELQARASGGRQGTPRTLGHHALMTAAMGLMGDRSVRDVGD